RRGAGDGQQTVVVEQAADAIDRLGDTWTKLWTATRPLPPMLEYRWVRTWWQIHRDDGRLLIIIARDGAGTAIGIAPLYVRRDCSDPIRLLRTIHFLGTGERECDEVAGEYLGWLAAPSDVNAVTQAVARVLRSRADLWDRLHLINLCPQQ